MAKSKLRTYIPEYVIAGMDNGTLRKWQGVNTAIKDHRMLDRGQTFDEINWITGRDGDNIQLRRGKFLLGTTRRIGGHVSGMNVGVLSNGVQTPVYTANSSVYYLNQTTQDTAETSTANLLGSAAANDDTSVFPYTNVAGSWLYIISPNSSIFKVSVANPATAKDQNVNGVLNEYKFGFAKADGGTFMGVQRYGKSAASKDATGFYLGRVDTLGTSSFGTLTMCAPGAPSVSINPGSNIGAATYYYVITAIFGADVSGVVTGLETTAGVQSGAVVVGGSGAASIQLTWTKVAGATSYRIYRTTSSGTYTSPALVGTTSGNADPTAGMFLDTSASPASGAPPSSAPTGLVIGSNLATGDGSTKSFSGTIPFNFVGASAAISGYGIQVTDGNEIFNDDKNGNLVGSLGGTGTVDYITGAYSLTFKTAPANGVPITSAAFAEAPTSGGILDFTINTGDTTGTYAQVFREDDGGGPAMGVGAFQGIQYILHMLRTWNLAISNSDADRTYNHQPYWSKIGIPYQKSFYETGDGVLYIDNTDAQNPNVSVLEIPPNSTNLTVTPVKLSEDLDLSGFAFTKAIVFRWGEYDFLSCMDFTNGIQNTYNSATFIRNIYSDNWDRLDYTPSCLAPFYGALLMGDFLSPNCFILFSGFDDDGSPIYNYRKTPYLDLELQGLKQVDYLHISGLIQPNQQLEISLSFDFGNYSQVFTVLGDGPYVDTTLQEEVGGATVGSVVVGAGGGGGTVYASPFEIDIPIFTDLFQYLSVNLTGLEIGYVQVDGLSLKGVHWAQRDILPTQTIGQ